jgi:membrane associated rhomboid family serine protease
MMSASPILDIISKIPIANSFAMALCLCTYVYQITCNPSLHHYTMNPRLVLFLNEYYRLITSCLFHGSLMHIGMNMMSAAAIGNFLERKIGTLKHGITILWSMLLTSLIHILVSYGIYLLLGVESLMYQHSLGFSGVLFHLTLLQANLSPKTSRDVFGLIRVSSTVYPWVLLVMLQFLMPNLSFLGHLSGLLVGTLQVHGALDCILPSDNYLRMCEKSRILQFLASKPGFINIPPEEMMRDLIPRRERLGLAMALMTGIGIIWKFIKDVAETIKVCIFGYGNENRNIHISVEEMQSLGFGSRSTNDCNSEDEWDGLPAIPNNSMSYESRMV